MFILFLGINTRSHISQTKELLRMKVYDKIIQTASKLFHTQGYNSTGINQIIAEAKVAKGSFYYNFKSKEAVCIAYLNTRHDYWFDQLKEYVQENESTAPVILSAFDFLFLMNQKENFQGCSFLNILSEISNDNTSILTIIQNHKTDVRNYLASLLENSTVADHIYLLFESAIIESQLFKNQWPIEKAKTITNSLIN